METTCERFIRREKDARIKAGRSGDLSRDDVRILINSARYHDALEHGELHFLYTTETGYNATVRA